MNVTQFNKNTFEKIEWKIDTKNFGFKKIQDLYEETNIVQVFGFFFVKSENYGLQPVAILKDCLLNLPIHKRDIISDILKNLYALNAIKNGEGSLTFRQYKSKYNKVCYDFDFVNTPKTETTETPTEEIPF